MVAENPVLRPLLDENAADNDGVLPHLLMSDIVRWLVEHVTDDPDTCCRVMDWMERQLAEGTDAVQNVAAVSGVEMLPYPGEPGDGLRNLMGPNCRSNDPLAAS